MHCMFAIDEIKKPPRLQEQTMAATGAYSHAL